MKIKALVAGIALVSATASFAAPIQWTVGMGGNDHWYEFIATNVAAPTAFTAAAGMSYLGMQGYLATVTSAAENTFVSSTVAGGQLAWLGGSDDGAAVNDWTWRVGPEAGQAFVFTAWGSGEPNNVGIGENYVHTNWCGTGCWNDHGNPNYPGQVNGYVVEYSSSVAAVPEPETYAMMLAGLGLMAGVARRRRQRV